MMNFMLLFFIRVPILSKISIIILHMAALKPKIWYFLKIDLNTDISHTMRDICHEISKITFYRYKAYENHLWSGKWYFGL